MSSSFSGTAVAGKTDTYSVTLPTAGRYVIETTGPTITVGLWKGVSPVAPNGVLRVCGSGRRGSVNGLTAGVYTLTVLGGSVGGAYTITVRPFGFSDNFTLPFYKSTC
jgi:hypothetical protein